MKFVFAGTPAFAARVLADLGDLGRRPCLVISQPDRPRGRGCRTAPPPAAVEAARLGLECLQTEDINSPAVMQALKSAGAETLVVAAFGQMLRRPLLDEVLCLNIHASLLPAYRGASPVERALAAGEAQVGMTIMRITEELDGGPWALQTAVSVSLRDDAGSIRRTLALLGAQGVDQVLSGLSDGTVKWTEQETKSSYAAKLSGADCVLDTARGAKAVHDQVRSLSPDVGIRATTGDLQLKIWRTWPYGQLGLDPVPEAGAPASGIPGSVVASKERLFVGCAEGVLEVLVVQPVGKNRMGMAAFLRGYGGRLGERLDPLGDDDRAACACEPMPS